MTDHKLAGLRVAILSTDGFEQPELLEPKRVLEAAGAKTDVIAPKDGKIYGMNHHDKAGMIAVNKTLETANPGDYDAVVLPGGALNADALRVDKKAQEFVRQVDQAGKPIAVICHGSWLLVSAGLVKGRLLTSYHTIQDDLKNAGARWEDKEVVRDRTWVSSRKPDDLPAFTHEMLDLFAQQADNKRAA